MSRSLAGRGRGALERMTVNLTPRTQGALERVTQRTGDTKTDSLNRAIQLYDYLNEVWDDGGQVYVQRQPDGQMELLRVF